MAPWPLFELVNERRTCPPGAVRVNAVRQPKTLSKRESELLWHVARSKVFKIPREPYGPCRLWLLSSALLWMSLPL